MSKNSNPLKRSTLRKTFLENLLKDSRQPLSASEILNISEDRGVPVGRVTVYRFLKSQLNQALLHKVQGPQGEVLYEWVGAGDKHQHHFFCRKCEGAFPLNGCGLKLAGFDLPKGFEVERHEIQLIGLCGECQAA